MHRTRNAGLALLGLLSVLDVATPLVTDGNHPPMAVALVAAALGLASVASLAYVMRGARRAVTALFVLRGASAVAAAPALFVSGVPGPVRVLAGGIVVLTAVGIGLARGPRLATSAVTS